MSKYIYQEQELTNDGSFWYTRKYYTSLETIEKRLNQFPTLLKTDFDIVKARKVLKGATKFSECFDVYEINARAVIEPTGGAEKYWKTYEIRITKNKIEER